MAVRCLVYRVHTESNVKSRKFRNRHILTARGYVACHTNTSLLHTGVCEPPKRCILASHSAVATTIKHTPPFFGSASVFYSTLSVADFADKLAVVLVSLLIDGALFRAAAALALDHHRRRQAERGEQLGASGLRVSL